MQTLINYKLNIVYVLYSKKSLKVDYLFCFLKLIDPKCQAFATYEPTDIPSDQMNCSLPKYILLVLLDVFTIQAYLSLLLTMICDKKNPTTM